ncbi:sensor histidine kinase [Saccharibacillus sp. CPCC 101409]|uniref:sensor histidine kinase n=1 Tax=Saccharibacillus sp. CPCC 101409 TaxID=3058041 RepID=UPI002671C843|nr:sensor histidine kinase [Saccharibacillus sp. CPCC 101409]MDO3409850.1 sensor histidine kinase [Saccharibacillus sp. CPCC 101409]
MQMLYTRRGSITVSLILLFIFWTQFPETISARAAAVVLCLSYIAGLNAAARIPSSRVLSALLAALYAMAIVYWLAFDDRTGLLFTLQGFLLSYMALKLPERLSAIEASAMLLLTFLLLVFYGGQPWLPLIRQDLFIYVGLYMLLRLVRLRRIREDEQRAYAEEERKHTQALQVVHAELAEAHADLQRAHEELERATVQSLRYAVLEERSRIARDIHDSIGHRLTSVIVQLQALPYVLGSDPAESERIVRTVLDVARACMQEVRTVVHDMGADETGAGALSLRSLVRQAADAGSLKIGLDLGEEAGREAWPPETAAVLYRCTQEALTNTIRHANAKRVDIRVEQRAGEVSLHYRDDGELKPGEELREGFGLSGIRKRCRDAGGECVIEAAEPHGISIEIRLPLAADTNREARTHG